MYILIFIVFMLLSLVVSQVLKSKFRKYSAIPIGNGYTGKDIAEKMLRDNSIYDVQVISVEGQLTDHYNPEKKTVNLSQDVYHNSSVSAAAVAAHECGHAVQHAQAYAFLKVRSALVPAVSFASNWMQWVLLAGILMVNTFPQLLLAGIVLFAATTLFSFITLPVEIDASRRALIWLLTLWQHWHHWQVCCIIFRFLLEEEIRSFKPILKKAGYLNDFRLFICCYSDVTSIKKISLICDQYLILNPRMALLNHYVKYTWL